MKKITALIMLLVLGMVGLCGCAEDNSADPSWKNIKQKGSLVIGVSENNLPLTYRNSSGNMAGFDIEVATEVCRRLNIKGDVMVLLPSELKQKLEDGTIDCYWSGLPESSREVEDPYNTTSPYLRNDDIFLLPVNSEIKNIAQLKNKRLGHLSGSTAEKALENAMQLNASLKSVEAYDSIEQAFSALNSGEADVLALSETLARYFMNLNPDRYKIMTSSDGKTREPLDSHNCVIALRRGENALCKKLEDALESMQKDGKMKELTERWFGGSIALSSNID